MRPSSAPQLQRANLADAVEIARLLRAAYADHLAAGLNFHAATITDDDVKARIKTREIYVIREGIRIVGTFQLREKRDEAGASAYLNGLAIPVDRRGTKFGASLLASAEAEARRHGWHRMRLDTAKSAAALLAWYERRGYRRIGEVHWPGKTYDSVIMEKVFAK